MMESIRGTWPFLLHRPATRRWVVAVKFLVGLSLYLVTGAAIFWHALSGRPRRNPCQPVLLVDDLALLGSLVQRHGGLLRGLSGRHSTCPVVRLSASAAGRCGRRRALGIGPNLPRFWGRDVRDVATLGNHFGGVYRRLASGRAMVHNPHLRHGGRHSGGGTLAHAPAQEALERMTMIAAADAAMIASIFFVAGNRDYR